MNRIFLSALCALCALLLAGCAGNLPKEISEPVAAPTADVAQARGAPEKYRGRPVRWGGGVVEVRNLRDATELEVVARPLGSDGRPQRGADSSGRFLARVAGFLDPALYDGRMVTVAGRFTDVEQRPIGEYDYRFPVVDVERLHLWPEEREPRYRPAPWPYYDPFWSPWRRPYYGSPFWDPFYPYWW